MRYGGCMHVQLAQATSDMWPVGSENIVGVCIRVTNAGWPLNEIPRMSLVKTQ